MSQGIFKKIKSKARRLGPMDELLYQLGLVALGIFVAAVLLYFITGLSLLDFKFYYCIFNSLTGLACPGCGGTRSFIYLLKGDILMSIYYYPPLIYGIIVYMVFMVRCFLYRYFGVDKRDGAVVPYVYIGVALILIQWVVKLVAALAFGYDWLLMK